MAAAVGCAAGADIGSLPEARGKKGTRIVGGFKELVEKLGCSDPCPSGSGRRFQELLHARRQV